MKVNVARTLPLVAATALLALLAGSPAARAEELKGVRVWTGEVEDAKLLEQWPNTTVITNKDDFANLWKSWAGKAEVPAVDFGKELVFVSARKDGRISNLRLVGEKGGNFVSAGSFERMEVKGFTYTLTVLERDGIKSINDKPVK